MENIIYSKSLQNNLTCECIDFFPYFELIVSYVYMRGCKD